MTTHFRKQTIRCDDLDGEIYDTKPEANVARIFRLLNIKYERVGRKGQIPIKETAEKYGFRNVEKPHNFLNAIQPDFFLTESKVYIEIKPNGITENNNDWMRIASIYLQKIRFEVWGEGTYKLLEKAFRPQLKDVWDKGIPVQGKSMLS